MRINGEEHSADAINGSAVMYFPTDGQMMNVSECAFKLIINNGIISGQNNPNNACQNWVQGINTYPTYESWLIRYPVGQSINVDCSYGCQCWDYAAAFWYAQVNRRLLTGPNKAAWECWDVNRVANAGDEFDLITAWKDIKKGDWIVWGYDNYGHIAMALSDSTGAGMTPIMVREQNGAANGGWGSPLQDRQAYPDNESAGQFLGAFRYKKWHES